MRSNKGATTKKLILDDDSFWNKVDAHVSTTLPLFKMLRRFDSSAPAIGKVYSSWFEAGEHLQSSRASYKDVCIKAHQERWAYGHSDFAAAAYCLDPEFIEHQQESNEEVMEGFMNVAEKIGILREVRSKMKESDYYTVQWMKRVEAIGNNPSMIKKNDEYPNYPTSKDAAVADFCSTVNMQLTLYRSKKGTFARPWVIDSAEKQPAYMWWDANGASCTELQYMARLVLSQPASSSICERINSEFAFVKDLRRNRLEHKRSNKLVALFHNLRLMARLKKPNYSEPVVGWNQEDDNSGVTTFGVANYEGTKKLKVKAPATRPSLHH